jgi:hypothetical protein
MMPAYLEKGLLKRNPFETIDRDGVGELVKPWAAERGRAVKPDLKLGVCGEHGGDPESIALLLRGRPRLRVVLAVPHPDRPAGRRPRPSVSGKMMQTLKSGEGLIMDFTGPGQVWTQTRSPGALIQWLTTVLPFSRS